MLLPEVCAENSPDIQTPAVQHTATAGAGGPYGLERAHGPEQRRQRRWGVARAAAAARAGIRIVFDPSLAYETITLSSGPLALGSNLTINGLGADLLAISGNQQSQLFTVKGSVQVTLANLTLTGGMSSDGGAVRNEEKASLTLDSDILSDNQAVQGGAVFNRPGAASPSTIRSS